VLARGIGTAAAGRRAPGRSACSHITSGGGASLRELPCCLPRPHSLVPIFPIAAGPGHCPVFERPQVPALPPKGESSHCCLALVGVHSLLELRCAEQHPLGMACCTHEPTLPSALACHRTAHPLAPPNTNMASCLSGRALHAFCLPLTASSSAAQPAGHRHGHLPERPCSIQRRPGPGQVPLPAGHAGESNLPLLGCRLHAGGCLFVGLWCAQYAS
jgi:hypothetical protein